MGESNRDLDISRARRTNRQKKYYRKQAEAIYDLQMREAVIRLTYEGVPDRDIAKQLGQSVSTIRKYRRQSIRRAGRRSHEMAISGPPPPVIRRTVLPQPPITHPRRLTVSADYRPLRAWPVGTARVSSPRALPPRGGSSFGSGALDPSDCGDPGAASASAPPAASAPPTAGPGPTPVSGTVLEDTPEIVQLRKDCLFLRKAMIPFDKMAERLGISEQEARQRTYEALDELRTSEMHHADLERQLMLEQINEMILAVRPPAIGYDGTRPPIFEAVDRMVKLLKQKAELMGLTNPPAVDLMIRLQAMASEGGYDITELQEIARERLAKRKIHLPEFNA